MAASVEQFISALMQFLFYYPLFMAYIWMIGAIYYYFHWEAGRIRRPDQTPDLSDHPGVSFVVPCHNEEDEIEETISFLVKQDYPNFDIIAINDGSTDETGRILDDLSMRFEALRVIHLAENQGKAVAMKTGAMMTSHEFLVCIDGDALLDRHATAWMMSHFLQGPRVGAVTGNPRIRTRSSLLGKIQVGEFSAIIGLIKRAQRIYGRVFTVSGVVSAFRKSALQQAGYWNIETVTDDIDISWRLQLNHWDIRYEPNALCWILMPETLRGLLRQRLRWAQGGMEALLHHGHHLLSWRSRRMWGVCFEYLTSIIWAYLMAATALFWLLALFFQLPTYLYMTSLIPAWHGVVLGTTCLIQFFVSLLIDSRYEKGIGKYYYWMVWYPLVYWVLSVITTVVSVPRAILRHRGSRGSWLHPDRGLRE
jgi:biofilm PGA synthesis N-glycosyltransferase PgaC